MSVINKMLRDLDKRGGLGPRSLEEGVRDVARIPEPEPERRPWGKITAGVILVALGGAAAWYALQPGSAPPATTASKPEPKKVASAAPASQPASATQAPAPSTQPAAPATQAPAPSTPAPAPSTQPPAPSTPPVSVAAPPALTPPTVQAAAAPTAPVAKKDEPRPAPATPIAKLEASQSRMAPAEVARLENAAASAARMDVAGVASAAKEPRTTIAKADPQPAPIPSSAEAKAPTQAASVSKSPASAAGPSPGGSGSPASSPQPDDKVSIQRADRAVTGPPRAAAEYRSANDLLARGNVEAALARYADALRSDPTHVAARQSMIVVMLDQGRSAEAQAVLRQGIAAVPQNTSWPMLLARLQVEAGDVNGALETLGRSQSNAQGQAEYHAFMATLLQMQGRHREAIAGYETAARIAPEAGRWLVGMAISLEAEKRTSEAREVYRQALTAGNLGRDLEAYAERKVRQLQ